VNPGPIGTFSLRSVTGTTKRGKVDFSPLCRFSIYSCVDSYGSVD
jgi:hypothetical protein